MNNFKSIGLKVINKIFQMRPKDQRTSRTSSVTPKSIITFDHFPLELMNSKDKNLAFKASIPVKQYTNKFFRQTGPQKDSSTSISFNKNPQKRFNILMKKKQMIGKQIPKQQLRLKSEVCEYPQRPPVITIKGYPSTYLRKRAVTQIEPEKTDDALFEQNQQSEKNQSSIMELEQQLVMTTLLPSSLQSPCYSSFLKNHTENVKTKPKPRLQLGLKEVQIGKISQSRGLQLFSKLYIKEKSVLVEKLRDSSSKFKKITLPPKEYLLQSENSFETKKIYPIQKNNKRQQLVKSIEKKRNIQRTPMRNIENRHTQSIKSTISREHLEEQAQIFQIKGWDTTL